MMGNIKLQKKKPPKITPPIDQLKGKREVRGRERVRHDRRRRRARRRVGVRRRRRRRRSSCASLPRLRPSLAPIAHRSTCQSIDCSIRLGFRLAVISNLVAAYERFERKFQRADLRRRQRACCCRHRCARATTTMRKNQTDRCFAK